jgi:hypothetical protein
VLSTGFVVDMASAVNPDGSLKLMRCPFTRQSLRPEVRSDAETHRTSELISAESCTAAPHSAALSQVAPSCAAQCGQHLLQRFLRYIRCKCSSARSTRSNSTVWSRNGIVRPDSSALVLLRERCCAQIYTLGERLLARNSWDEALEVHEARIRFAVE